MRSTPYTQKVRLDIHPKHVVLALGTLVAIACGAVALIEFELRNMQIDLSGFAALANLVSATAEVTTLKVPPCPAAARQQSAGYAKQEATMAYVAGVVDLYRMTFRKLPENIADLDKLPTFENADKLNGDEMKKTCSIQQVHTNAGYVLACGGKLPKVEQLNSALARTTDEQFVTVDGIEVLYVPLAGGCI